MWYQMSTEICTSHSDTDPDTPRRGFSSEELTKMIQKSISTSVVVILDCCYSVSAKVSKGREEDAAKIGSTAIDEKSRKLPVGKDNIFYLQGPVTALQISSGNQGIPKYA
jgi:hypothetical protein